MSRPVIAAQGLGKSYRITHQGRPTNTLREALSRAASARWKRARGGSGPTAETFWALRDATFEVRPGEVLGVVGRNGAGKSTLLKVLSRITEPTRGYARIRGRVGALLEVGTGFHPELTGRENIYLNGSILGMRRAEIERKFDEIVAFAEVEKFLDTPVKHYSSGMYVRLAFGIAAHLEPEILIIDEVLAVGDAAFQKKCLGRIEEVTHEGRTVLFVSHNMPSVMNLCTRCLLMERGKVKLDGPPAEVMEAYAASTLGRASTDVSLEGHPGRSNEAKTVMRRARVRGLGPNPAHVGMGDDIEVEIEFRAADPLDELTCWVFLKNQMGANVFSAETGVSAAFRAGRPVSAGTVRCRIEKPPLMPGVYSLDLFLGSHGMNDDVISDTCRFEVHPADVFGTGRIPQATSGSIAWPSSWEVEPEPGAA